MLSSFLLSTASSLYSWGGRLFFHLVHYSLPFLGFPIANCCPPWSCSLKCPFSSLWHASSAQLWGADVFPFPRGASCWVVFHVWHSSCIKALLRQQCEKERYSRDFSVSSWWCLELPFCFLKLLDGSGLTCPLLELQRNLWSGIFSYRHDSLHN